MFKKNFVNLCAARGESPTAVCKKIGLSNAAFSCWDDNTVPRQTTLRKLADYFGVTVDSLLADTPEEQGQELSVLDQQNIHMIPLYENASAGFGALANDEIVDYIPLYIPGAAEAAQTICIKVRGDSMSPKIEDGDIVQVLKQDTVDSGNIAVVLYGDQGLVKIVICGEGWIELRSINSTYKPLRLRGADLMSVRVVGLVKKIIKSVSGRYVEQTVYPPIESEAKKELLQLINSLDESQLEELQNYVDFLKAKKK